ncbi:conjugal transfer protein TraD [Stakelama saccharophila]|uniref:Conjugal transfer protein TraD n=1 Tax=Stakelama saccharophila TaxID=3075605 RepID=A0ABZ0B8L3_9SPHN|nr:conjugal transfer protein TraD [Stakelama sp. W311]WNO53625.1 conjugal transfer protein TraD [Stakelama sp. W311]
MRKPRDYDSELKALGDKARKLRERKVMQLGELVQATDADALPVEELAGALIAAIEEKNATTKGAWRQRGEAFFRGAKGKAAGRVSHDRGGDTSNNGGAEPAAASSGAA